MQRMTLVLVFLVPSLLLCSGASRAGTVPFDPGCLFLDGFESGDQCAWMGSCPAPVPDPAASAQILAARSEPDGSTSVAITGALVTYTKETIGNDQAGFFVQAELGGPALFVAVDPVLLVPTPVPGMIVSFTITEMGTSYGLREALVISGWSSSGTDAWVPCYRQQVSEAPDVVTGLDAYESELVGLRGTIAGAFAPAGTGFESAELETAAITDEPNLKLRIPIALGDQVDLTPGCAVTLVGSPLWRFLAQAQPSAWVRADLVLDGCPAPHVLSATAADGDTVSITSDRELDDATVLANGSQFTFDNGLLALSASASGTTATVTTTIQSPSTTYTVTVSSTVRDTLGQGVDPAANSAMFLGSTAQADVLISELNANIAGGCDLVELTVTTGGTLAGLRLAERATDLLVFGDLMVNDGDVVVVHLDSNDASCNPSGATNETTAKDEQPASTHPQNYDAAYDWYSTDSGITNTDNVLTVYDALGLILDAVFASDDPTGTTALATEAQAAIVAAAGEWEMVGGGVPVGGFVDDAFNAHAAQDLNGTGTDASGETIRRLSGTDTNTKADWGQGAQSWGAPPPG